MKSNMRLLQVRFINVSNFQTGSVKGNASQAVYECTTCHARRFLVSGEPDKKFDSTILCPLCDGDAPLSGRYHTALDTVTSYVCLDKHRAFANDLMECGFPSLKGSAFQDKDNPVCCFVTFVYKGMEFRAEPGCLQLVSGFEKDHIDEILDSDGDFGYTEVASAFVDMCEKDLMNRNRKKKGGDDDGAQKAAGTDNGVGILRLL